MLNVRVGRSPAAGISGNESSLGVEEQIALDAGATCLVGLIFTVCFDTPPLGPTCHHSPEARKRGRKRQTLRR